MIVPRCTRDSSSSPRSTQATRLRTPVRTALPWKVWPEVQSNRKWRVSPPQVLLPVSITLNGSGESDIVTRILVHPSTVLMSVRSKSRKYDQYGLVCGGM